MSFTLVSRGGWGARSPRSVTATVAKETFVHHSVSESRGAAGVRAIQDFHLDVRGWADIAYNFLIDRFTLVVYEGRGWGVRPASQSNYNASTWSVCVMGDFRTAYPTQGLIDTIAALIRHGHQQGRIPLTLTGGHRDAPGQSTTCPGTNLYAAIPSIRNQMEEDMPSLDEIRQLIRTELDLRDVTDYTGATTRQSGVVRDSVARLTYGRDDNRIFIGGMIQEARRDAQAARNQTTQSALRNAFGGLDSKAIADQVVAAVGAEMAKALADEIGRRLK